jgi:hypothetical protein
MLESTGQGTIPTWVTDLFPDEERKHSKLRVAGERVCKKLINMLSVAGEWGDTRIRRNHQGRHRECVVWTPRTGQGAAIGRLQT